MAGIRPAVRSANRSTVPPPSRRSSAPADPLSRREVLRRWEELEWWACTYCDRPFGPKVVAEVDHVRPVARGGLHIWSNLAPACADCNRSKGDREVVDWLAGCAGQSLTSG
ncbi:HNH endonuclease [Streptomyces sp. CBG33]|uniref:HNH endonuclease n=1 Tax=Streptomyces sp. CBG33 TaxID=2762624 RepID=UPI0037D9A18B